jgi:hypothetical protein
MQPVFAGCVHAEIGLVVGAGENRPHAYIIYPQFTGFIKIPPLPDVLLLVGPTRHGLFGSYSCTDTPGNSQKQNGHFDLFHKEKLENDE